LHKNTKNTELNRDKIGILLGTIEALGDLDPKDWIVEGPVIRTRRSDIYRASHPEFAGMLCVKCPKPSKRMHKTLYQEYKNLTTYSAIMAGNSDYGVPKPVACLPEKGMLVLEWIDGASIKIRLLSTPNSRHTLLTKASRWLKEFHKAGGAELALFEPHILADQVDFHLNKKKISYAPCKKVAIKVCRDFRRETERLPASQELHSFAHRDFTPGNVIITDDKIMGIDITMNKQLPIFEDITRFLADLTVNRSMISVAVQIFLPFIEEQLQQDEKAIVSAYFGETAREKNKQVLLFLLLHMTKKMLKTAALLSEHQQSHGFRKPLILAFRYHRYWKRRLVLYNIRRRLR